MLPLSVQNKRCIMADKNTKVLMEADFSFHLGKLKVCENITQEKALELVRALSERESDKESCADYISAEYTTEHRMDTKYPKFSYSEDQVIVTIALESMKCCNKRNVRNERTDSEQCLQNIQCGLCKDKNICATIGAILFPEKYQNKR